MSSTLFWINASNFFNFPHSLPLFFYYSILLPANYRALSFITSLIFGSCSDQHNLPLIWANNFLNLCWRDTSNICLFRSFNPKSAPWDAKNTFNPIIYYSPNNTTIFITGKLISIFCLLLPVKTWVNHYRSLNIKCFYYSCNHFIFYSCICSKSCRYF